MRTALVAVLSIPAFVAACGGGGGGNSGPNDARQTRDAEDLTCLAAEGYGNATLTNQGAAQVPPEDGMPSEFMYMFGDLNADAMFDAFYMELAAGYGAFTDTPIAPGTYELSGEESDYATCGVCAEIDADINDEGEISQIYFANGGSITINSITPNLSGTITNATFVHSNFDPDDGTTTPHQSGCQTTLTSASFDVMVETIEEDMLRGRIRIPLKKHHASRKLR